MSRPGTGQRRLLRAQGAAALALVFAAQAAQAGTFRVTSAADDGEGTLRAAIASANGERASRIEVRLAPDAEIVVTRALPPITAAGTRLDGGGVTLREAPGCRRGGGEAGCDGVVVRAAGAFVRDLRIAGFTFDGLAVRGVEARGVRLENIHAIDNLDDGIGVSEGAGPVEIVRSLLMGNGFRTKGKGLLVFDGSTALLRDSVVVANRDGVTVSRGGRAILERVTVAGNYDKGVGISGGRFEGSAVSVLANGEGGPDGRAPNGDGLRIGLDGSAEVRRSRIAGNRDAGVVVLDRSSATLIDCEVESNRRIDVHAGPESRVDRR